MKKLTLIIISILSFAAGMAQAPNLMNFQGVARNPVGNVIANKNISVRLSVHDGTPAGAVVYRETRAVTTNAFGLFNIMIGSTGATGVTGTVAGVNWLAGSKYIQLEVDPAGGAAFDNVGTTQLVSVPYAFAAGASTPAGPAGGDLAGTYPNPTLSTTGVPAGSYGNASNYSTFNVDSKGRLTAAGQVPLPTSLPPNGAAGGDLAGTYPNPALSASGVTAGTYGNATNYSTFTVDAKGRITTAAQTPLPTSLPPGGAAGGDLTGTYPNPSVLIPLTKTSAQAAGSLIDLTNSATTGTAGALKAATASTDANAAAITGTVSATAPGGFSSAVRGINNGTGGLGIGVYGSQAGGGWGVYGFAPNGMGVNGSSTAGVGLFGSSTTGNALQTAGKVQLTGIGEGAGKVLVSDATGFATWQTAAATGITGSGTINTITKFTPSGTAVGNSQLTDDGTSVGISTGTLSPNIKLQVNAGAIGNAVRATLTGTPSTSIATAGSIYGESTTGIGVIGVSGTQNGVYGLSTGTLGGTVGVATGTGNGLWGVATGAGVAGFFEGGVSGRGIIVSTGSSGFGTSTPTGRLMVVQPSTPVPAVDTFATITGSSYTAPGCLKGGVFGTYNGSNYGVGIQGVGYNGINNQDVNANFTTGNQDLGVYGSANTAGVEGTSTNGIGVVGYNKAASFAATTGGGNSYGVYAYANTIGGATAPTTRYGLYGYATGATTNYAGYFSGNVQITGSIAKASGTFKIDHPLDPENKYLYHSFVESPDMMNIYNGNITTDASGYATVELPDYFDALNKDCRYQLTVVGGTFAQAIVAKEEAGNQFTIRTNEPNVKVSWQVTGIRKDKYAEAHRVVPVVEKEAENKGKYLHAKEWGKSESQSIDYNNRPGNNIKPEMKRPETKKQATVPESDPKAPAGVQIETVKQ